MLDEPAFRTRMTSLTALRRSGGARGSEQRRRSCPRLASRPCPLIGLGLVDTVLVGVALAVDLHVAQLLLDVRAGHVQARDPIDDVDREAEAVDLVADGQIERRVDV